jgi:perosamine synthetase
MNIRLFKPSLGEEELANVKEVFDRAWLGSGPMAARFEKEWSAYIGATDSVAVNSATAGLQLALTAFGFPRGKKVLVPTLTFIATALAPLNNGLDIVWVDCDPETLGIDLDDLERKADGDCVAVMPVHMGGHPAPMNRLMDVARAKGLKVVEDCAHCAGGEYGGKKLGLWGDIGCFSFEEKKCMTSGDGGMISSMDAELVAPLRLNRWFGIDKDTWKRADGYTAASVKDARHWYYEISVPGWKYNMNDLSAAIGLAQLPKLDRMNARRSELIRRYLSGLEECHHFRPLLPYNLEGASYWVFGVRTERRDDAILHLKSRGIPTSVHYMPLHLHPLFRNMEAVVPNAEKVWHEMITLPLHADLTEEEVDYILQALRDFEP